MKLEDYMTLKEIEEDYGVKAETIRNYIRRNQVIPKEKLFKLGRQWLIDRTFAKEKWETKKEGSQQ